MGRFGGGGDELEEVLAQEAAMENVGAVIEEVSGF